MIKGERIRGIGTDFLSIRRLEATLQRRGDSFVQHMLTRREIRDLQSRRGGGYFGTLAGRRTLAGRICAKEAVVKSAGTGLSQGLTWHDVEVFNAPSGSPWISVSSKAKELWGTGKFMISISHCQEYANAFALCLEEGEGGV